MRNVPPFALSLDTIADPARLGSISEAVQHINAGDAELGWLLMGLALELRNKPSKREETCSLLSFDLSRTLPDRELSHLVRLWSVAFYDAGYDFFLPEDTFDEPKFLEQIRRSAEELDLESMAKAVLAGVPVDDVFVPGQRSHFT